MHIVRCSEAREDLAGVTDTLSAARLPIRIAGEDGQTVVTMSATAWAEAEAMLSIMNVGEEPRLRDAPPLIRHIEIEKNA